MAQGIVAKPEKMTVGDYWKDFLNLMDEYPMAARHEYTDNEFAEEPEWLQQEYAFRVGK